METKPTIQKSWIGKWRDLTGIQWKIRLVTVENGQKSAGSMSPHAGQECPLKRIESGK